jgi:hypothetical protein
MIQNQAIQTRAENLSCRYAESSLTRVSVYGFAYRVDQGQGASPRFHIVRKDRSCACRLGRDCPAVRAVVSYLLNGGERAPDPPHDFWIREPGECPICGGPVTPDPALASRRHGRGWHCLNDAAHYWEMRAKSLIEAQRKAYAESSDVPGLPGIPRQTVEERAVWLQAHRIAYSIWE